MVNAFLVNAMNHGYSYDVDPNTMTNGNDDDDESDGESESTVNTVSYQQFKRHSIFSSYVDRLRTSKMGKSKTVTLDVLFNAKVTRILFAEHNIKSGDGDDDGQHKHTATGVEVVQNGKGTVSVYLREDEGAETVPFPF